jgi:RNA polymerase sigma-70 factor (ECF subfamily)
VVISRDGSAPEAIADGEQAPSSKLFNALAPGVAAVIRTLLPSMNAPADTEPRPEELARRCQAGCVESFEQLVRRFESQVFNFLRQFTRNPQDAEDLTQETFVKAYRGLHRYSSSLAFAPWLFVIARRTAASHFRSATHFEELPVDSEATEENPATALEQSDEQKSLWKLVRTLKPKQAEAVWLRYAEGFSIAETARVMRTNQVHVKVLLHRARSNLFKMLNARGMTPAKLEEQSGADRGAAPVSIKSKVVL